MTLNMTITPKNVHLGSIEISLRDNYRIGGDISEQDVYNVLSAHLQNLNSELNDLHNRINTILTRTEGN